MSKNEEGKPELTLVYKSLLEAVSRVREYGIKKYGKSEDWRTTPSVRHFDAMLRHIYAYLGGEYRDSASGLPHLWHAAGNIMFEIERRWNLPTSVEQDFVEIECPRCKNKDEYPSESVNLCTNGCGYIIEPFLERILQTRKNLCTICKKNFVDSVAGFDTCDECLKKL